MAVEQLESPAPPDVAPPPTRAVVLPIVCVDDSDPAWLRGGNIPGLDGLRAISIAAVVLGHASLTWSGASADHSRSLARLGSIGVDLFFVISGFLITLLLLRERRRHGTISLRAFYVRRAWRILPAYAVFLVSMFGMSAAGLIELSGRDWTGALTYSVNFLPGTSWPVGHLWSLSVEEHFYLLWPLLLFVLGPGRGCALAAMYILAGPLIRWSIWQTGSVNLDIDYCTPARIDTIAVGCLLAYFADQRATHRILAGLSASGAGIIFVLVLAALVVSNTLLTSSGLYAITIRRSVDAVCFAGMVWTSSLHTRGALGRLLNAVPLVWLGRLSYGLYLWQQPFLNPHADHWACQWPVNVAVALLFAVVSFVLVERPALRLRQSRGWGNV